jgi:undecaprenyl pyrophosphate synthase
MQRSLSTDQPPDIRVAIIMDGNGRRATAGGLPRTAGHRAGAERSVTPTIGPDFRRRDRRFDRLPAKALGR